MTNELANRAIHAAEHIDTKTTSAIYVGAVKALTYALLDVAQAIREHRAG